MSKPGLITGEHALLLVFTCPSARQRKAAPVCRPGCEFSFTSVTMGQKLHSKRQRKQRANASLKRKQFDRSDDQFDDKLPASQRYCVIDLCPAVCACVWGD